MEFKVIFGTESGGGELTAEDLLEELSQSSRAELENMSDIDVQSIDTSVFHVVICSTYGEGELPLSAKPFYDNLISQRPNLEGLRYCLFARGDSTYSNTYSQGADVIDRLLSELGATRVGDVCRHDASDWSVGEELALDWIREILELV